MTVEEMGDVSIEQARVLKDDMSQPYPIRNLAANVINFHETVSKTRAYWDADQRALESAKAQLEKWLNQPSEDVEALWAKKNKGNDS